MLRILEVSDQGRLVSLLITETNEKYQKKDIMKKKCSPDSIQEVGIEEDEIS